MLPNPFTSRILVELIITLILEDMRESVFESMTYKQWQLAVKTKVDNSINLHNHLADLDFFVLLSSVLGQIESVSQANYAAGNTFQDAVARHKVSLNLPALSLDLTSVTDVGFVANQIRTGGINQVQWRVEGLAIVSFGHGRHLPRPRECMLRRAPSPDDGRPRVSPGDVHGIMTLTPWDQLQQESTIRTYRRFGTSVMTGELNTAGTTSVTGGSVNPTAMLLQALQLSDAVEKTNAVAQLWRSGLPSS
ncbi:hypothetical protein DL546_006926 [Coniochaeta pulveracea]|uniref:Ketoreductase (KR) domain-containing protein n=1 Tax=Coniochaeta pulveracea TaxID=177199 RepID=A0A420YI92_9PEZI|nr:hypothetical protein DL546_006926 [Coniochaeta pulveracea]